MKIYTDSDNEKVVTNNTIAKLDKDSELEFVKFEENQHFTQPPAHFTEAALVKAMEEQGIGRPSTYAPTIGTIVGRRYVTKEKKNLCSGFYTYSGRYPRMQQLYKFQTGSSQKNCFHERF